MTTIGKTRRPLSPEPRGVLHRLAVGEFAHGRFEAPADLADRVEHFWRVRWNLEGHPPQVQETLPHPNVHLVVEPGRTDARGVHTGRWTRVLEGRSQAFGIKFRPGAFRALLGRAVADIADAAIAAHALFGDDASVLASILDEDDATAAAVASSSSAHACRPPTSPRCSQAASSTPSRTICSSTPSTNSRDVSA